MASLKGTREKLETKYTATEETLKQICGTNNIDDYPISSKNAYIIPVINA